MNIQGDVQRYMIWVLAALLMLLVIGIPVWFLSYRIKSYLDNSEEAHFRLRRITKELDDLKREQKEARVRQEALLSQVIKNNEILLRGVTVIAVNGNSSNASSDFIIEPMPSAQDEARHIAPPRPMTGTPDDRKAQGRAAVSYFNLINKTPGTPEPIYLEAEDDRTVEGKLADTNVYLSQVNHSQGSLVLFTDDDASGWVYPNPTILFIGAALKEVFPTLTKLQFDAEKENISPRRARRVSEGRWKVETDF